MKIRTKISSITKKFYRVQKRGRWAFIESPDCVCGVTSSWRESLSPVPCVPCLDLCSTTFVEVGRLYIVVLPVPSSPCFLLKVSSHLPHLSGTILLSYPPQLAWLFFPKWSYGSTNFMVDTIKLIHCKCAAPLCICHHDSVLQCFHHACPSSGQTPV
jgi:hypothetical protein